MVNAENLLLPLHIISHRPSKRLTKWGVDLPKTFQIVFSAGVFLTELDWSGW
jgi:hypothetical protein